MAFGGDGGGGAGNNGDGEGGTNGEGNGENANDPPVPPIQVAQANTGVMSDASVDADGNTNASSSQPSSANAATGPGNYDFQAANADFFDRHYDPNDDNYHKYGPIRNVICRLDEPGCTVENVFEALRMYAAPGQDEPATTGHDVPVQLEEMFPLGMVRQKIDEENHWVSNSTVPGQHALDPGYVKRSVIVEDGAIKIETVGEGTGPYPTANRILGPVPFNNLDAKIRDTVVPPANDPPGAP